MHRNVAYDTGEWRGQVVVSKLASLGDARRRGSFPVGLGILVCLYGQVEVLLAGHAPLKKLALTLYFLGVVVVRRLLLCFGAALLVDGRLLFQRIDRHQRLSGMHV